MYLPDIKTNLLRGLEGLSYQPKYLANIFYSFLSLFCFHLCSLPLGSVYFFIIITFWIVTFYLLCNDFSHVVLFVQKRSKCYYFHRVMCLTPIAKRIPLRVYTNWLLNPHTSPSCMDLVWGNYHNIRWFSKRLISVFRWSLTLKMCLPCWCMMCFMMVTTGYVGMIIWWNAMRYVN